jgi:hypothetical protein
MHNPGPVGRPLPALSLRTDIDGVLALLHQAWDDGGEDWGHALAGFVPLSKILHLPLFKNEIKDGKNVLFLSVNFDLKFPAESRHTNR